MLSDVNNIKNLGVKTNILKTPSAITNDPIMNEKHEKRKSHTTHYGPILYYIQSLKKKQEQRRSSTESEPYSLGPSCQTSHESLDNVEQKETNKENNDPHQLKHT